MLFAISWMPDFYIHRLNASSDSQYSYINEESEVYIKSSKEEVLNSVVSEKVISIEGKICLGCKYIDIDDYLDYDSMSRFEIVQWLNDISFLSYEEKIDCFCDIVLNRFFENSFCLNPIFNEMFEYKNNTNKLYSRDLHILLKIDKILSNPFENQNSNLTSKSVLNDGYLTTNFKIHYDSSLINQIEVIKVAEEFERIRAEFIIRSFETPILESLNDRYNVYLDPYVSQNGYGAVTSPGHAINNTCSSSITIYNFDEFNPYIKEVISHEYFHAIQNAYNYHSCWFKEAAASWAIIEVNEEYPYALDDIYEFVSTETGTTIPNADGSILLPLTIEKEYGGYSAIRSIYEEYNEHSAGLNFTQLKQVITNGIINNGYSNGSFDEAYKKMMTYIIDIESNYEGFINWQNSENCILPVGMEKVTGNISPLSNTLNPYSSKYNKLYLETLDTASIDIYATFNNPGGSIQLYIENKNGTITMLYYEPVDNAIFVSLDHVGENINSIYIITSNTSGTSVVTINSFVTYIHYHNSNKGYQYENALNHNVICSCDTIIVEPHNFKPYGSGNRCIKCLYYTEGPVIVGPIYKSE